MASYNLNDPNLSGAPPVAPIKSQDMTTSSPTLEQTSSDSITSFSGTANTNISSLLALPSDQSLSTSEYSQLISTIIDNLRETLERSNEMDEKLREQLLEQISSRLSQNYQAVTNLGNQWAEVAAGLQRLIEAQNVSIGNFNQALDAYAVEIDQYIKAINNAREQFNQNLISEEEFLAFIDLYNGFVSIRNQDLEPLVNNYNLQAQQFNANVDALNTTVDELNTIIHANHLNMEDIPHAGKAPGAGLLNVLQPPSQTSIAVINPLQKISLLASNIPLPPSGEQIDKNWNPFYNSVIPTLMSLNKKLEWAKANMDSQQFFLKGMALPDMLMPESADVFFTKGIQAGISSDILLSLKEFGLDAETLQRLLSISLIKNIIVEFDFPIARDTLTDLLCSFGFETLSQLGLLSALPSIAHMGKKAKSTPVDSKQFKLAKSLSFATLVKELVEANITGFLLEETFRKALKGPVDNEKFKSAAPLLSKPLNLSILLIALFLIASALGLPGLIPQIIANLSVDEKLLSYLRSAGQVDLLKSVEITGSALSTGKIRGDLLADSLMQQLVAKGNNSEMALAISQQAVNFLFSAPSYSSIDSAKAILKDILVQLGIEATTAEEVILSAVLSLRSEKFNTEPLLSPQMTKVLPLEEVKEIVQEEILARLGNLSEEDRFRFANKVILLIFGVSITEEGKDEGKDNFDNPHPFSLINLLNEQLAGLNQFTCKEYEKELIDTLRAFLHPSLNLFMLSRRIMDPADTLITSILTSAMYQTAWSPSILA